jgi:hypothetical protein
MDPNLSFYIAMGVLVVGGGYILTSSSKRRIVLYALRHPFGPPKAGAPKDASTETTSETRRKVAI